MKPQTHDGHLFLKGGPDWNRWRYNPTTEVYERFWEASYEEQVTDPNTGEKRMAKWICEKVTKRTIKGKKKYCERWSWTYTDGSSNSE